MDTLLSFAVPNSASLHIPVYPGAHVCECLETESVEMLLWEIEHDQLCMKSVFIHSFANCRLFSSRAPWLHISDKVLRWNVCAYNLRFPQANHLPIAYSSFLFPLQWNMCSQLPRNPPGDCRRRINHLEGIEGSSPWMGRNGLPGTPENWHESERGGSSIFWERGWG